MSLRVTLIGLKAACERINKLTGSPLVYLVNGVEQPGHYHISQENGGVSLHRLMATGGIENVLSIGHMPKSKLMDLMWAFIYGLKAAGGK